MFDLKNTNLHSGEDILPNLTGLKTCQVRTPPQKKHRFLPFNT